jgi:hypothetical protein
LQVVLAVLEEVVQDNMLVLVQVLVEQAYQVKEILEGLVQDQVLRLIVLVVEEEREQLDQVHIVELECMVGLV